MVSLEDLLLGPANKDEPRLPISDTSPIKSLELVNSFITYLETDSLDSACVRIQFQGGPNSTKNMKMPDFWAFKGEN